LIQHGRRVLYLPCSLLVQHLLIAKRELTLSRLLKRTASYDAVIIDDIGYVQHSRHEMCSGPHGLDSGLGDGSALSC